MNLAGQLGQDSDGWIGIGIWLPASIDLYGGSGSVSGSNFSIAGFSGTTYWRGQVYPDQPYNAVDPDPYRGPTADMNGTISRSGANASVSGNYQINSPGSWGVSRSGDSGTFIGGGLLH
jgi:hypothetical protein